MDPESTNPAPEAPVTEEEVGESLGLSAEPETEAEEQPETEVQPEAEDDSEEVEHEGQKYKVPKALKPALMMHRDYTQKTQEVAESRRALEAEQQAFQQARQAQAQNLREYAQLSAIDSQLEQFQSVNWQQLSQTDPVQAQQLFFQQTQLKEARQTLASNLQQREHQALEAQRSETAKRIKEGQEALAREIKGWNPELAKTLSDYGKRYGFSEQELGAVMDPRAIKLLHDSYTLSQLRAQASQPKQTPAAAKPAASIPTGKSTVSKKPWDLSQKEFEAHRKAVIAKR